MARKKTVEIEVIADTSKATRGLKDVGDTAERQGSKFSKLGSMAKVGLGAAAVGVGLVVDFLKDATTAAMEDERAQADLALALQNTTGATEEQIAAAEKYIDATARATGVSDDELRPALETLTRATGDLDTAQDQLAVAMDIAAATGKPLQAVVDAISKAAQNGSTGGLARLNLRVKDLSGEAMTLDEILQEASRTMGGAAATAAETAAGQMDRLKVSVDEAKEQLGTFLIPAVADAAGAFNDLLGITSLLIEELDKLGAGGNEGLPGVSDAAISMIPIVGQLYTGWQNFTTAIGGAYDWLAKTTGATDEVTSAQSEGVGVLADYNQKAHEAQAAQEGVEGQLKKTRTAQHDLTNETKTYIDVLKGQADPVFAAVDAAGSLTDAQATLAEVQADTEASALDVAEAEIAVARALFEAQGAMDKLSPAQLNASINAIAVALDKPQSEVRTLLEQLGILDGMTVTAYVDIRERIRRAVQISDRTREQRHSGGTVQGAFRGQEVPIIARAGEHVSQGGRPANGHEGGPMVIQFNVDGRKLFEQVVLPEQVKYAKRNGRPV